MKSQYSGFSFLAGLRLCASALALFSILSCGGKRTGSVAQGGDTVRME